MKTLSNTSTVRVVVPARTSYLRHLRVLAATVADDCGLDVSAIEALRIAVDELCALAIGDATDDAELDVTIESTPTEIVLSGTCGPVEDAPEIDPIAASLLAAGSSSHTLSTDGDTVVLGLRAPRPLAEGEAGGR